MPALNNHGTMSPFPYGRLYPVPASMTVLGLILYHITAFSMYNYYGDTIIPAVGASLVWIIFFAVGAAAFVKYPHPAKLYIKIIAVCMVFVAGFSALLFFLSYPSYDTLVETFTPIASAFVWTVAAVSMCLCMKERPPSPIDSTTDSAPENHEMNVDDYEDEVIGANEVSIIYSYEAEKDPVKVKEDIDEEVVYKGTPEMHLDSETELFEYEEDQDAQAMVNQVASTEKYAIKMTNEAERPEVKPKQSASVRNRKLLEP